MPGSTSLPHWDVTSLYPNLESPQFKHDVEHLIRQLDDLESLYDQINVRAAESNSVDQSLVTAFDTVTSSLNRVLDLILTIRSYINAFVTTDASNNQAQAFMSELQVQVVRMSRLRTRYDAWVGSLDLESLLTLSEVARQHQFMLSQAKERAIHQMSEAEEDLAAHLNVSGGAAWVKLHENFSSSLMVTVPMPDGNTEMPMSAIRNLAGHPDRTVRKAAYEAELAAWEHSALPLAAALNGIKGEVNTLVKRRGYANALLPALRANIIEPSTLEAMQYACKTYFPVFRRYLQLKAQVLGVEKLAWYDLMAPLPGDNQPWPYDKARQFIVEQFGTYSSRLAAFAERAFAENWIDAEPRRGKRDGAFCMAVRPGESRILSNYSSLSFSSVSTLAHELGHGYHNLCLTKRTALQRITPMTLAETASIFCETLVTQAALRTSGPAQRRSILEIHLKDACQVVVDIYSRFLFEQHVFAMRQRRELSIDELNQAMLMAQQETYGDGLDQSHLHPYMWAVKSHYYSTDRSYYNYPYTFGLLFGLGLYAQYEANAEAFRQGYDELLASTGLADAATLAKRFGIDINTPAFWESSLAVVSRNVDVFATLIND